MLRTATFLSILLCFAVGLTPIEAQLGDFDLERLVDPSNVFRNDDEIVRFGINFFIEFETLEELFVYIDTQAGRWTFDSVDERKAFADDLLRRGVESRVISMTYEAPHEVLVTHTWEQLAAAIEGESADAESLVYKGEHWNLDVATYRDVFLALQERWKTSLNCWSAAASVPERVLSNWYIIPEGITLFGASYDSTEHFWQAIKYHPGVRLTDLAEMLDQVQAVDWGPWLEELANDQEVYLAHGYTVEFLKQNLAAQRLQFFDEKIEEYGRVHNGPVRVLQQRTTAEPWRLRFTALMEKIFWGDLADTLHLLFYFAHLDEGRLWSDDLEPLLKTLRGHHFDGIYLPGYLDGKVGFISPEFQRLMLEIWRVKFLEMQRFREVIRSTAGYRLLHFLNDGDSPDIPISVYVGYLEQIRRLALGDEQSE